MTHEELVADIDEARKSYDLKWDNGSPYLDALRAVVELHKPREGVWWISNPDLLACSVCIDKVNYTYELEPEPYPCPTIQAIEKELK